MKGFKRSTTLPPDAQALRSHRGSALLGAVFVLALLTGMAVILLFASNTELKMSHADVQAKQAFYLAEAGTETGREQLRRNLATAVSSMVSALNRVSTRPNR